MTAVDTTDTVEGNRQVLGTDDSQTVKYLPTGQTTGQGQEEISDRLRARITHWKNIETNATILNWISEGATIPFTNLPAEFEIENRKFNQRETEQINSLLKELQANGAIHKTTCKPMCISPINLVPKKGGKVRLVTDHRQLNTYIKTPYFKNEGIDIVARQIKYDDHCTTIDLKSGYHHVPIHPSHQTYLGIKWQGEYFEWTVCPFGLQCSGYFFNKIIREVVSYLRSIGVATTFFVDDGIISGQKHQITDYTDLTVNTLIDLGFQINYEKSRLTPSTTVEWIGYKIDTKGPDYQPWIYIPRNRINKLRHDFQRVIKDPQIKARHLARITGQCISMCKAILPAKLKLRNIYKILRTKESWHDIVTLDQPALQDCIWWIDALHHWNGAAISERPHDVQIETDASGYGWGAKFGDKQAAGVWDQEISQKPSNVREFLAIILAVKSFAPCIRGKTVQILSDNIACVANINNLGGPSGELSKLAQSLWALTYELNIKLTAKHLAGYLNVTADRLSRDMTSLEWKLHPKLFRYIDGLFGPHTIDRFASYRTTQLKRYNSRWWDPESEAVDAMAQNWRGENNFINAPFKLLPQILDKIETEKATATIIAPAWKGQHWYNRLCRMTTHTPLLIPNNPHTMIRLGPTPEPLKNKKWKIYAWKICGRPD